MTAPAQSAAPRFHFDRVQLLALADGKSEAYQAAKPFPHTVIDEFLAPEVLDEVLAEFPNAEDKEWFAFDSPLERKLASNDDSTMGEATRHLLAEFNSAPFIDFLQRLTGIEGLVPDPHFVGGGLHQIERGGHLAVHADFNEHPGTGLHRRLNVLIYLNRDWKEEYGGALELWSRDMSSCEARVLPEFNRCVVFSTTSTSFHGNPEPVNCPEGGTRKSMALYYYTGSASPDDLGEAHNTLFQARPGEELPDPSEPTDATPQSPPGLKATIGRFAPQRLVAAARRSRARRRG
jgi:hypothetical protein